eukprot:6189045-Pleurochrysis_carterae.AAC.1
MRAVAHVLEALLALQCYMSPVVSGSVRAHRSPSCARRQTCVLVCVSQVRASGGGARGGVAVAAPRGDARLRKRRRGRGRRRVLHAAGGAQQQAGRPGDGAEVRARSTREIREMWGLRGG